MALTPGRKRDHVAFQGLEGWKGFLKPGWSWGPGYIRGWRQGEQKPPSGPAEGEGGRKALQVCKHFGQILGKPGITGLESRVGASVKVQRALWLQLQQPGNPPRGPSPEKK